MKTVKKLLFISFGILFIAIVAGLSYLKFALPNVNEAPDITIDASPENIERGKYLAHSVRVCMDCHSERDWSKFSGPPVPGTLGKDGEVFDQNMGFPGKFVAKNIHPLGLGS